MVEQKVDRVWSLKVGESREGRQSRSPGLSMQVIGMTVGHFGIQDLITCDIPTNLGVTPTQLCYGGLGIEK